MFYIVVIVIILLILYVLLYNIKYKDNDSSFKYEHSEDSILILSDIKDKIKKLIIYCKYNENNKEYLNYIKRIDDKIDKMNLYENIDYKSDTTSYTINKGQEMAVCLRSKNDKKIHDINEIMYVIIHEISHIACPELGHTKLFLKINKYFLQKSIEAQIYIYDDYAKNPIEYCGIEIDNNLIDNNNI